jgi:lipopolysaccharide transport system permease protein
MQHIARNVVNQRYPVSFLAMFASLSDQRNLVWQMTKRSIAGRYKGTIAGIGWSMITPLLLLVIYTFVFGVVFSARWRQSPEMGIGGFAIFLYSGLILHAVLADCVNKAPHLILNHVSYVKKMVFPIEILAWVTVGGALFHLLIGFFVLIAAQLILNNSLAWTAILFPVVFTPLIMIAVGMTWLLAAVGVYVRDINQITGLISTGLLFLAPVFYPVSRIPETLQPWLYLNPLTFVIEQGRSVLLLGEQPNWIGLFLYTLVSLVIAQIGFWLFQRTRRGFADVL